ncbi:hypothetical protein BDP27DRAFT_1385439 [Rhodocollybia butyracea]|uniref:CxC5 like cysteine cluster associated with KDZ domain-containing protein n=1 Tax=Rhodocollybia butyracea TaxID=206335 RepID=A0A9P5TZP0_9AGAR|nr:hypothetical protein BDP27DRAFT_1385439 [Rhodocollybia butyracea]
MRKKRKEEKAAAKEKHSKNKEEKRKSKKRSHSSSDEAGSSNILQDIHGLFEFLGVQADFDDSSAIFPKPKPILVTKHLCCILCSDPNTGIHTLRRREDIRPVKLLDKDFTWTHASLIVARCVTCRADYYPDRIVCQNDLEVVQSLEYDATYLRVSKHGIWVHRTIAIAQERAIVRFRAGWSNFADYINETVGQNSLSQKFTNRQSTHMLLEHLHSSFTSPADPSSVEFAEHLRNVIGKDGGILASSMEHTCPECTHKKRYLSDLILEGLELADLPEQIAEAPETNLDNTSQNLEINDLLDILHQRPAQVMAPPEGHPRGYVRMAVMDGKTATHRKCALGACKNPLVNYKNGRFCLTHLALQDQCRIVSCGRPVQHGAVVCSDPAHIAWHQAYLNCFHRISFPGVQRVMRRQNRSTGGEGGDGIQCRVNLPSLPGAENETVSHTFQGKSIYCLQTVQWACVRSPQALAILDNIWKDHPELKPSFVAYDDACNLLRHIATQDITNAWHYIGHKSSDILCQMWCKDDNGRKHTVRAFNMETAEQLNAWITPYEAQLHQMSDVNSDLYIHALMMLYKESVEKKQGAELGEEFWNDVL